MSGVMYLRKQKNLLEGKLEIFDNSELQLKMHIKGTYSLLYPTPVYSNFLFNTGWESTVHVSHCAALYSGCIFVPLCRELIIFVF